MATELTNEVLAREMMRVLQALDSHDASVSQYERKLAHMATERDKALALIDALLADFPELDAIVLD